MTILFILITILLFGALIAIHEFGHFIAAKTLGVRVEEFAIGMGPKLLSRTRGETTYSLRALPIGGFCSMEGEEEASDDPRSFSGKPAWKKFIILVAGAFLNFVTGLVILLGVKDTDSLDIVPKLADKCAGLRIFPDAEGKLNLSARDLGYSALVVSQFTLYGDTKKGYRPSFIKAAKPPLSVDAYELFLAEMNKQGLKDVQHGEFGADMQVSLVNEGPCTIIIDTDEWKKKE